MTRRAIARVVPALAVLALLAVAAAAPPPGIGPAVPSQFYPGCDLLLDSGGGDSSYTYAVDHGITQPLPAGITAAACSLRTDILSSYNVSLYLRTTLREWDPLTLAPAAGTIALRTLSYDLSRSAFSGVARMPFVPPLVTRSVDRVAEPMRLTTALDFECVPYSNGSFRTYYDPAAVSTMPAARVIGAGGVRGPLPGAHPVIAHAVCGGDDDLQQLRVAQSVVRQDLLLSASPGELVQRFRVPEPVELRWIELALGVPTVQGYIPALVGIVDASNLATPTQPMPAPLVEASFAHYYNTQPQWASHYDLDHTIVLQPFHDYWLWVRSAQAHAFYARQLTGSEGADFTANIGAFYTRPIDGDPWKLESSQALDFRIIGRPLSSVGVAPLRGTDSFTLRIAPNPTRTQPEVRWSGAVGPVKLEVLDARGRRVATGEGGAAGTWRMTRGVGSAPLPAGVYFVHARDSAGGHAVGRVVIVR